MIKCNTCQKEDFHYTENRNTSIGCYHFWRPYEYKYVCDDCIIKIINELKEKGISKFWYPFEVKM